MYEVKISLKGICPILFNRMTEEAGEAIKTKTSRNLTEKMILEDVEKAVYRDNGFLVVEADAIEACLLNGVKKGKIKMGKSSAAQYVEPSFWCNERKIAFTKNGKKYKKYDEIDGRWGRRPPKTGGRAFIRRPVLVQGWELHFEATISDDRVSSDIIKRGFEEAGMLAGLYDGRPKFGRFIVTNFEIK